MSLASLSRSLLRYSKACRTFARRTDGIAAVEFALILPLMCALFMGAVEISQAVTANRRVSQVGSTAGDLVARASGNIYNSMSPPAGQISIDDIMNVSSWLISPFPVSNTSILKVDVSVVSSSAVSATDTKQKWKCTYDSSVGTGVTCTCPNSTYTLPSAGMLTTTDSLVVAEVRYGYRPALFNFANPLKLMGTQLGGYLGTGTGGHSATYTMTETVYLKPRAVCPTINKSDGSTCGC